MDHRNRAAPVALARDQPVPQPELHLARAPAPRLSGGRDRRFGVRGTQAIKGAGMDQHPRGGPGSTCEGVLIAALGDHHLLDRQFVLAGKDEIALVVGGHAHHGAGAVLGEHVVGDPDGEQLAAGRVAHAGTNGHTPLGPVFGRALLVALAGHQVTKSCHGELLVGAGQGGHQGVLGR